MTGAAPLVLGDGVLEVPVPDSWRVEAVSRDTAKVRFPTGDYPVLGVALTSIEDPAALASGNVAAHLQGGGDGPAVEGDAESGWRVSYQAVLDGGEEVRVWRTAAALPPDHLRIATFALSFPATDEARVALDAVLGEIAAAAVAARFSGHPGAPDREAAARARADRLLRLERAEPWDGVALRLPADWRRLPGAGPRGLVLEPDGLADTLLVVEGDVRPLSRGLPGRERAVEMIRSVAGAKEAEDIVIRSAGEGEFLLACQRRGEADGSPLRERFWHRFLFAGRSMAALNVTLVHPDGGGDAELYDALADTLGREVAAAELAAPAAQLGVRAAPCRPPRA